MKGTAGLAILSVSLKLKLKVKVTMRSTHLANILWGQPRLALDWASNEEHTVHTETSGTCLHGRAEWESDHQRVTAQGCGGELGVRMARPEVLLLCVGDQIGDRNSPLKSLLTCGPKVPVLSRLAPWAGGRASKSWGCVGLGVEHHRVGGVWRRRLHDRQEPTAPVKKRPGDSYNLQMQTTKDLPLPARPPEVSRTPSNSASSRRPNIQHMGDFRFKLNSWDGEKERGRGKGKERWRREGGK